jgi:hypothetical protein
VVTCPKWFERPILRQVSKGTKARLGPTTKMGVVVK